MLNLNEAYLPFARPQKTFLVNSSESILRIQLDNSLRSCEMTSKFSSIGSQILKGQVCGK